MNLREFLKALGVELPDFPPAREGQSQGRHFRTVVTEEPLSGEPAEGAGRKPEKRRISFRWAWPLPILILGILFFGSFYSVRESDAAVLQTFGRYSGTVGPGLHFKLPWPIQTVSILPVERTQKIELGYYQDEEGAYHSDIDNSLMITGDMNVVNIDFFLEWKISDPVKYLFESENPTEVLRNLLTSSARSVVGTKDIDDTLTTGKFQIESEVEEILSAKLTENDIGIQILNVKVNDSEPPTEEVSKAFRDVENAKQKKDVALNQAVAYKNERLPEARARADQLIKEAEAGKASRIAEAEGLRDRYLSIYNEYRSFPEITRQRMYLEVLQKTFPYIRVILDESGSVAKYYDLGESGAGGSAAPIIEEGEKDRGPDTRRAPEPTMTMPSQPAGDETFDTSNGGY